ncbi:MAG: universal stress protein UspA [Herpetosiphonaceae bacterium]|nr:MAG: universal stress protein UspA [Herpetosiphonaceae bacterium]
MEQQILVPLDGSALAEAVLPPAAALARATGRALTLMRVIGPVIGQDFLGFPSIRSDAHWMDAVAQARSYLTSIANGLRATGLPVSFEIEEGKPAERIVTRIEHDPAISMVAMATHGRSGLQRWVLGSVAEKVLRASSKPLLLVRARENALPDRPESTALERILVPLDGSPFAEQALDEARRIAAATGATLLLLSVTQSFDDLLAENEGVSRSRISTFLHDQQAQAIHYLTRVAEQLEGEGFRVMTRVNTGDPARAILERSETNQTDLIVMATHGRGGIQRLWYGSVATRVIQAAQLPVLLIRAQEPQPIAGEIRQHQQEEPVDV